MSQNPRNQIQQRALSAMLTDAFFTWPSAVLIGFSIFATAVLPPLFAWWQPWFWIVFGVVAELIYLVATLTDPVASQQAVSRMLTEKFDPGQIKNISARQRLQKALEYERSIDEYVNKQSGALKVSLSQTADDITDLIGRVFQLAKAIDNFEANKIIDQDRRAMPTELESLKHRLDVETDPGVKQELQEAINIREQGLNYLQSIGNAIKRTDIQIDNTLAQLSTIYAQMQLIDTKEIDGPRSQRLRATIKDQIASLSDTLSSIDDVNNYQGYKSALNKLDQDPPSAVQNAPAADSTQSTQQSTRGGNG